MQNMKVGDRVKILSDNYLYNTEVGTVVDIDVGCRDTFVDVKLDLDGVIHTFPLSDVFLEALTYEGEVAD